MGKKWTNAEQEAWLEERLSAYLNAKVTNTRSDYLLLAQEDWFKRFPEREALFGSRSPSDILTSEEETSLAQAITIRQKQIDGWFGWRARKIKKEVTAQSGIDVSSLRNLIDSEAAKEPDRAPQKNEIYLRLYPEKVKAVYDSRPKAATCNAGVRLNLLKAVAQDLLEEDTDEVKKEVQDEIVKWKEEKVASLRNLANSSASKTPTPAEYQSALKRMPLLLRQMMEPLAHATGWSFAVLCGGPVPSSKGEPCTSHYHFGPTTPAGNDFTKDIQNRLASNSQQETAITLPSLGTNYGNETITPVPSKTQRDPASPSGTVLSTPADMNPGSPISMTHPSSASPDLPSPERTINGTDEYSEDDDDPLGLGTFSFSDNRPIVNSTTRTDELSDHVQQNASSKSIDQGLVLSPRSRIVAQLPEPWSQEQDSGMSAVQPEFPSETFHPGGPTEPLSRALIRELPISNLAGTSSDGLSSQRTCVIDPRLLEVTATILEVTATIENAPSSALDAAVKGFVFNPANSDYMIPGAGLNPSPTLHPDNKTDHVTSNAPSPILEPAVNAAVSSSSNPEPTTDAPIPSFQESEVDKNPETISTVAQTKKRARVQSNVSNPPPRVGSRVRKGATFGPIVIADPAAPTKRVKHSWTYASDDE